MGRSLTRAADDRGSSVVEFVLVCTLLMLLFFGALQVAVYSYARTAVAAAAADGARQGAALGASADDASRRAQDVLKRTLPGVRGRIRCQAARSTDVASGLPISRVRCTGDIPAVLAPLGIGAHLDLAAAALAESVP